MSELSDLREQVWQIAGGICEWPTCGWSAEELAHIQHRGMGGNPSRNTVDNTAALCRMHHRILDGETVAHRRYEVSQLLQHAVRIKRREAGIR